MAQCLVLLGLALLLKFALRGTEYIALAVYWAATKKMAQKEVDEMWATAMRKEKEWMCCDEL